MKTVFCPKTGTVGTSPGHVRDMSGTSATKVGRLGVNSSDQDLAPLA